MLSPKIIRNELDRVVQALEARGVEVDINALQRLEMERKQTQTELEQLQFERNRYSKEIGELKAKQQLVTDIMQTVSKIGERISIYQNKLVTITQQLDAILETIPNIPHTSVPIGRDEESNELVRQWGQLPEFDFTPKDHVELGGATGLIDFETATKIAGTRFVVLQGGVARLHRALAQFMLDTHINLHGYEEINVPYLVNAQSCYGTGQLPKFQDDLFQIKQGLYLIPTSEVPVTNLARDRILSEESLPKKYVCYSACFRSEAGSYGQDTRGMIRQHQFDKVELVTFSKPDTSHDLLEKITSHAEYILQALKLPYRVMKLCSGDLGFSASKTYDLEVWLPGQQKYREISSCSNFEDFQARRMSARYKDKKTERIKLLHTLNGSALAIGRTLIAILENYQDKAGQVHIPEVLRDCMGGLDTIKLK